MKFQTLIYVLILIILNFGLSSCSKEEAEKITKVPPTLNPQILFNNGEIIKLKNSIKENIVLSSIDIIEVSSNEDFSLEIHSVCAIANNNVIEGNFTFENVTNINVVNILPYKAIYRNLVSKQAITCDFEFKYFSETLIQRFFIRTAPITLQPEAHRNYIFDKRIKISAPNTISFEEFAHVEIISSTGDQSYWHLICENFEFQITAPSSSLDLQHVLRDALFKDKTPFYINSDNCIFIERDSRQNVRFTQALNLVFQKATPIFYTSMRRHGTSSIILVDLTIYNPFSFPIFVENNFNNKADFNVRRNDSQSVYKVAIRQNNTPHLNWKLEPNQSRSLHFDIVVPFEDRIGSSNILCLENILNEFTSKNENNPNQKVTLSNPRHCYNLNFRRFE